MGRVVLLCVCLATLGAPPRASALTLPSGRESSTHAASPDGLKEGRWLWEFLNPWAHPTAETPAWPVSPGGAPVTTGHTDSRDRQGLPAWPSEERRFPHLPQGAEEGSGAGTTAS